MRLIRLLDQDGNALDFSRGPFALSLAVAPSPFDFAERMARGHGFVAELQGRRARRVVVSQSRSSSKALIGLIFALSDYAGERLVLTDVDRGIAGRLLSCPDQLVDWITDTLRDREDAELGRFHLRPLPLIDIAPASPFAVLHERWKSSSPVEFESFWSRCRQLFRGRCGVLVQTGGDWQIAMIGDGYSYGPAYTKNAVGTRLQDLPDTAYGRWVAGLYEQTAKSGLPRFDEVDAHIHSPCKGTGSRFRYDRIVVPLLTPSGRPMLVTAALDRPAAGFRQQS